MRNILTITAVCGIAVLSVHAEDAATPPATYTSTGVLQAAGVDLSGEGFPGAGVEAWLAKPADQVVPLTGDRTALLAEVKRIGAVSVLSGNEAVMHLSTGSYERFKGSNGQGLITSKGIDVRLSPGQWPYAAAILPASGSVPGFIFFNSAGVPVHRILLTETSNAAEFDAIVAQFKGEAPAIALTPVETPEVVPPTEETKAALLEGWRKMQDTHEFSGLLNTHKVSRIDAARLAEGEFTAQLDAAAYSALFEQLMDQEVAIMFFALNDGCVQISTGAINEINRTRGTLQLVEDDSRTLVSLPRIAQVWRVSKPTERGLIHSLELYDAKGQALALLFGSEKGDSTSIVKWKELLFALPLNGDGAVKVAGETAAPAASSEEEVAATTEAAPAVDTFNLPRRIRSQISYTVKRMLEFDKNADSLLAQEELPKRMRGVIAKGDLDADNLLSKDELTRMAYDQIQKREAKAEAEPHEKH